jgi:L-asparagine transporter-like permease
MVRVAAFLLAKMLGIAVNDFNCKCFVKLGNMPAMIKNAINLTCICAGHMIVLASCKVRESKSKKNLGLLPKPGKY